MQHTNTISPAGSTLLAADHEVHIECSGDRQLFIVVVRESHGELELLTVSGAHSSTEANPEGVEFTLDIALLDATPELGRRLAAMDEQTAERVREILDMPLADIVSTTALLSDM